MTCASKGGFSGFLGGIQAFGALISRNALRGNDEEDAHARRNGFERGTSSQKV